ncbi:fibronectin type III and SPRY domain-containing protein 2 isoform X3 [Ursus arctos]|uniref:fibronectin type III and SPRY domain-containing protein 2 isoform X3 n=1 Tax=Ursus arctos TaxID=9644 RepID=UPI002016F6EC|nr:fibronectin type III and SPRY domain-containing protein 2 isoform X3 [Ursus arctos]
MDQGWACLLRPRCEPAGRQSARNHQILPTRANCVGPGRPVGAAWEELGRCRGAMDQEAAGAPPDFHFYPMDLYDSEDRLDLFPEEHTRTGRDVHAEMSGEPGWAAPGKAQRDLEEEVDELVHLYVLGGAGEWGAELADRNAPHMEVLDHRPQLAAAGAQRDWRLGVEAEDHGYAGWGAAGPSRELREAYRYAHGRASEEYECYVIPEEEDEDEAALVFSVTCKAPVRAVEVSDEHRGHEVTPLSKALESAKDEIHKNMFKLEKQIIEMENFANHLEEVFITVEDAVAMADRLGKFLNTETDVEISTQPDFEDQTLDFSDVEQLMGSINTIPAPSAPVINPQAPNSATGSSVRVCWSLYSDDTVESYQLSYRPVQDSSPGKDQAEFTMTVKETYCSVTDLVPNTQYEFWVTAQNRAGPSPASERAVYMTAPSPPVIKSKEIRSCEEAALICWESGNLNPVDSYTVELTQAETPEASGVTESVVGIPACEALVQLQPRQSYTIYVRALNVGGPSARSDPVTVRTTGSCFHLNQHTRHPWLTISEDGFTVTRSGRKTEKEPLPSNTRFTRCVAVMGTLIPIRGRHYWEVEVDELADYTVGVAFEDVPKQEDLGANCLSWCMRHTFASSRHKYEFLHSKRTPDIRITVAPRQIGILLDYENAKLSFFNVDISQHLYTFSCQLHGFVHPCFSLEKPGCLKIRNGIAMPKHVTFY